MYKGKKVSVVIPAYNEEGLIKAVINTVPNFIDKIYVVNDASTDCTYEIVADITSQNGKVVLRTHEENRGVGAAIISGYRESLQDNIDIAVVMAGDNQMDAKHLPELLAPIIQGKADYAKGDRLSQIKHWRGMSKWRILGNLLLTLLTKVASGYWKIGDPQNGYTAITADALKQIDLDNVYPLYGYCNDLLVKLNVAGCRVTDIPMAARYGAERSKIKYSKYIIKVSSLLLRGFLWRLRMRYLAPMWRR